jgi:hypothetical protein
MEVAIVSCCKGCNNVPDECTYRTVCSMAKQTIQFPVETANDKDACQDVFENALNNPDVSHLAYYECNCNTRGEINLISSEIAKFKAIPGGMYEDQRLSDFPRIGASR